MIFVTQPVAAAALCVALVVLSGCAGRVSPVTDAVVAAAVVFAPVVEKLSVAEGSLTGGETISIEGAQLGAVDKVMFGGEAAAAIIPVGSSRVDVVVPHSADYTAETVPVVISVAGRIVPVLGTAPTYSYKVLTAVDRQLEYAFQHWNDYNLAEYGDFTAWGGDCMDFVSQTLVARGWTTTDEWYNHAQEDWAPAFISVTSFDDWLGQHPELGAVKLDSSQRDQLKIGDIATFDWDNDGTPDHAQIVSGIRMINGVRHIYLVGHDIDTDYRDLDDAIKTEGGPDATVSFWSLPSA